MSTAFIIQYVAREFDVEYTASGMRDLLHRQGYVFKKPVLVPGKPDIEAQEDFVYYYDQFMETKADDVEVLFIDARSPRT